jgi:hypothetical protein
MNRAVFDTNVVVSGCALVKLTATRVGVPPVELDCSRPKAVSGKKP